MADAGDQQLCGYRIVRELSSGRTWLGEGGGRRVVLKILESDCLLGHELHPMIRDRLARVRELAHLGVASLYGVERQGAQAYLVWEYVDGATWDEYVAGRPDQANHPSSLCREMKASVESLHALGIVHGALHGRNVLIRPDGRVMLTHVSPLLYNDPGVDLEAMRALVAQVDNGDSAAQEIVAGQRETESPEDRRARNLAILGAILTAAAGALIAWAIWKWVGHGQTDQAMVVCVMYRPLAVVKGCICISRRWQWCSWRP